jgi:hypothetical protein
MKRKNNYQILRDITEAVAILEYSRQSILKNANPEKVKAVTSKDKYFKDFYKDPENVDVTAIVQELLNVIEELDQTPNKKYTTPVFNLYLKGGKWAVVEDLKSKVFNAIDALNEAKRLNLLEDPRETDIPFYKSIEELATAGSEYFTLVHQELKRRNKVEEEEKGNRGDYTVIYKDPTIEFVLLNDYQSSTFYCRHSQWCTAEEDNYDSYTDDGPLIVALPKKPRTYDTKAKSGKEVTGVEKYQLNVQVDKLADGRYRKGSRIYVENELDDGSMTFAKLVELYPQTIKAVMHPEALGAVHLLTQVQYNSDEQLTALVNDCIELLKFQLSDNNIFSAADLNPRETYGQNNSKLRDFVEDLSTSMIEIDDLRNFVKDIVYNKMDVPIIVDRIRNKDTSIISAPVKVATYIVYQLDLIRQARPELEFMKDQRVNKDLIGYLSAAMTTRATFGYNANKERYTLE